MSLDTKLAPLQSYFLGLLRIVTGYLFLIHGTTKLFQFPYIEMFANVSLTSIYGISGILELVGGLLIILGLFTRPTAFVLAGHMAAAYFIGHVASGGQLLMPILNGGELAVAWCFTFLYLFAAGAGAFALDNLRQKH